MILKSIDNFEGRESRIENSEEKKREECSMTNFLKSMVLVLIAFLVTQISVADESLIEDKERAEVNSEASAATNNTEKK